MQVDPETRSLVIVTDEDTHKELAKVIQNLDKPKPQVLIKVVFLEVTYNKDSDIGVEGSYTFNLKSPAAAAAAAPLRPPSTGLRLVQQERYNDKYRHHHYRHHGGCHHSLPLPRHAPDYGRYDRGHTALTNMGSKVGLSSAFGLATMTTGSFVRLVSDNWSATLHALAEHGKVEVLSRPSIMARNNQEAVIVVGQEVPFVTNSRIDSLGQTINTIQYDNVGIILRVTPFITADNSVEMIVAPEISNLPARRCHLQQRLLAGDRQALGGNGGRHAQAAPPSLAG